MIPIIRSLVRRRSSLEGALDSLTDHTLRGWACLAGHPLDQPPLRIEVSVNGDVLAIADAQIFRADLAAAGKRAGHCAFAIALDPTLPPEASLTVTAILPNGQRQAVPGTPITKPLGTSDVDGTPEPDVLPLPIVSHGLCGSLDQCGPNLVRGWAHWTGDTTSPVSLSLCEAGRELLHIYANQWRADLAELRDGDGHCGFEAPIPAQLRDGHIHILDLHRSDMGASVLRSPFRVRIRNVQSTQAARQHAPAPLKRPSADRTVSLSVIVNFYNMQREAERTLKSLGRTYQRDTDDFTYEVICIDNGSNPPLDPTWIANFGPEFRLFRPSRHLASPCAAINEAALQARGGYLAIMIDGAHVLTPGVFREARQAWHEHPDAVVAARHWFIGGDQRWLAVAGYTQKMEDKLLERIHWPNNGYELFRIGAPIGEGPEPWLEGMSESNCLMLPTALYDRIGGMDEAFQQPGGGFANLDLWQRACDASTGPLIALIGEASFHQFHGGTTTNVEDAEKDVRVRAYANEYRALRGKDFAGIPPARLHFRGNLQSEFATGIRQRPLIPARLSVTEEVRPGRLSIHFDDGAQSYLQSIYAESGLQLGVTWMGQPAGVAPSDLISFQEIIHQLHPDAVIIVGAECGLVRFIANVLDAMDDRGTRLLHISPASAGAPSPRLTWLHGQADEPHTFATARHWAGSAEAVLVLYDASSMNTFSVASLQAYGSLVSYRSYLICLGTLFGQPWLGYSNRRPLQTIRDFIRDTPTFVIDRSWNRQLISTSPSGYLRKIGGPVTIANYDPALDEIFAPSLSQEKAP